MSGTGSEAGDGAKRDALHTLCLADSVWAERYEGWVELGRGGSAAVVRTFNRDAGGDVALKIFYGLAAEDRVRFEREVRGAQQLASPFIVRTFSPFVRGSLGWIEMELVAGPDLRHELDERAVSGKTFTLAESCSAAACVAQALVAAHAANVVHRDVKPANVLLPASGAPVAKLSDFGISRILGATRVTATGLLAGTPQFAAPEVVAGPEVGSAADVYSLTLCLYLMLSGNRFPYDLPEGATVAQWLRAHSDVEPRPIRAFAAVPADVADLLAAGLAKDPALRPTAADFVAALAPWVGERPPDEVRRAYHSRRRRVGVRRAFGYALALLVGLASGAWLMNRRVLSLEDAVRTARNRTEPSSVAPTPVAALPRRPSPSATRAVVPESTPSPQAKAVQLRVGFQAGVLRISNADHVEVAELRITLRDVGGARYSARLSEPLAPADEVFLAADSFTPPLTSDFSPVRADIIVGDTAAGGRTQTFALSGVRE